MAKAQGRAFRTSPSHRLLFSHPELIEELIRRFVGGDWVSLLDFGTLEKVSERDVSPNLVRREKDLLWRLRLHPDSGESEGLWFYFYLHLEFQSKPERFMALRMLTYKALLYEDLLRRNALTPAGRLPPVLSVVLYNGREAWREARTLQELIEPLPGFAVSAQPEGFSLHDYRLIEERAYPGDELSRDPTPLATLFLVEQSEDSDDIRKRIQSLLESHPGVAASRLGDALTTWLREVLLPVKYPGARIPEIRDLTEVDSMLQEKVIEWRDGWVAEGVQKGVQLGREEGRQETESTWLLNLLEQKFGSVSADLRTRVESATSEQRATWVTRILDAVQIEEIFEN